VFVSSQTYAGNLGGVSGADSLCQSLAQRAGLTGTFKAWLGAQGSTPGTRWTPRAGRYVLRTSQLVANSWNEIITTATILTPIMVDKNGKMAMALPYDPFGPALARTGMYFSAPGTTPRVLTPYDQNCRDWTSGIQVPPQSMDSGSGWCPNKPAPLWSDNYINLPCNEPMGHIYCFEQ
jgi:hypothetical protein